MMPSILVIDDDASIAETLDLYLTEEGYKVRTALTGTEGLNKYVQDAVGCRHSGYSFA